MSMTVFLEVQIKDDDRENAERIMKETLAQTGAFQGNEALQVLIDDDDPSRYIVVETWAETADHDAYLAWRATPDGATRLGEVLTGPPVTRTFENTLTLS